MSSSITLSQSLTSDLPGLNLVWSVVNIVPSNIKEAILIYYNNAPGSPILSKVLDCAVFSVSLDLESGCNFNCQLQIIDTSNVVTLSNLLNMTAPYVLAAPSILSYIPGNNSLVVTLASSGNSLQPTSDQIEFILRRSDNVLFWVALPYVSSGIYTLSNVNDARLVNYQTYTVAALFNPVSNSLYNAPSTMSNTMQMVSSDLPCPATMVMVSSNGSTNFGILLTWRAPTDFSFYSSNFYIMLGYSSDAGLTYTSVQLPNNSNPEQYVFDTVLQKDLTYMFSVKFVNSYGSGPVATSTLIKPKQVSDAPALESMSTLAGDRQLTAYWNAPVYNGQATITQYKVYVNGSLATIVPASTTCITISSIDSATHIENGNSYAIQVAAVNNIGSSVKSDSVYVVPYGAISVLSVVVNGTSLTATIKPNGKALTGLIAVGMPISPTASETFVQSLPVEQYANVLSGNVTVVVPFNSFTSPLASYVFIATGSGSAYLSNIAGI